MVGVWGILGGLAVGYAGLVGGLYAGQRRILFQRTSAPPDPAIAARFGLQAVTVPGHDGRPLEHWYRRAAPGRATVVAFHGNAGTIADRADKLHPVVAAGFGLLLVAYRGYGGNPGRPDEPSVLADARAALDWLAAEGVAASRTAVYGESLGTAVAVAMAAERPVGAVVLDAPFTSVADLAQAHYWYVPARWLVTDRFDSAARIGAVTAPKLFLHGQRDPVVPIRFGQRLYAMAPQPKRQWIAPDGQHADLFDRGADRVVVDFLNARLPGPAAAQVSAAPTEPPA